MPRKQPPNSNNGLRFGLIPDKGNANIWLMVPCALHAPLKTRDWTTWTARPRVGDLDAAQERAQRCVGWSPRPKSSISNIFCSVDFSSEVPSHFFTNHWRTSQTTHMFSREQERAVARQIASQRETWSRAGQKRSITETLLRFSLTRGFRVTYC